ncbi:MAG: GntR family transcriptional regulator [Candidatus Eisenbacteria bacterium]|nr:GntR family transcriptional regulator [Candidatus Eisenbacteria bacterium]
MYDIPPSSKKPDASTTSIDHVVYAKTQSAKEPMPPRAEMESGIDSIDNLVGPRGTTDQVMGRIRDAIISGRISPGTWLREAQLATRLGVSRIPVREALARLEAEELVERVPYRGTRVLRLTVERVIESFMLRSLLEGFATKLATLHIRPEEITRLRSLVTQLEECARPGRHEDVAPLHREIHSIIYNRCGSAKLIRWINELYNQFPKNLRRTTRFEEPPKEYRRIVDAIEARDAELAGKLMSEHLENGRPAAVKHYTDTLLG